MSGVLKNMSRYETARPTAEFQVVFYKVITPTLYKPGAHPIRILKLFDFLLFLLEKFSNYCRSRAEKTE